MTIPVSGIGYADELTFSIDGATCTLDGGVDDRRARPQFRVRPHRDADRARRRAGDAVLRHRRERQQPLPGRVRRRRGDAVRGRCSPVTRAVHRHLAAGRSARSAADAPVDGDWTLKVVDARGPRHGIDPRGVPAYDGFRRAGSARQAFGKAAATCGADARADDRTEATEPLAPRRKAAVRRSGAGRAAPAPRSACPRCARSRGARPAGRGRPAGESPNPGADDAAEVVWSPRRPPGRAPPRGRDRQPALPDPPHRRGGRELPRRRQRALAGVAVRAALPRRRRPAAPDHRVAGRPGRRLARAGPPAAGSDFIRGNLFDRAAMRALPPDVAGPDNDLADLLDHYVQRAIGEPDALVYVFGERWGPGDASRTRCSASSPATASTTST